MLNILDIDVDLFLDKRLWKPNTENRSENGNAWSTRRVQSYLQEIFNLSPGSRIRGKPLIRHDQLLDEMFQLRDKIRLFHVDAHADLGVCHDLTSDMMHLVQVPVHDGPAEIRKMNYDDANFLAYACVCGFIEEIIYVTFPDQYNLLPGPDIPYFRPESRALGKSIRTKYRPDAVLNTGDHGGSRFNLSIPIMIYDRDECPTMHEQFDLLYVTKSPGYTPPNADLIWDAIVRNYLE